MGCALRCCYGLLVQVGCARTSHSQMCFRAALSIILWTTLRHLRARSRHSRASRIERKESVCALITEVVASGWATRADCAKIVGRARYVFCPVFGTAGLASLQPLTNPATKLSLVDGSPGAAAMRTLRSIVSATRPTHFHVNATNQRPVVVLTDACTTKHKLGGLGVVVWDPDDGPARRLYHEAGGVAPWMLALFERLQPKKTYIATYELLAEVCAYTSFPDVLRGRIIYHFVDNTVYTAALAGSIEAYSSRPDCARIIDALVARILKLSCRPWFGFVYSEDNLSDLPSRGSFELLISLGSKRRALVRPSLATHGSSRARGSLDPGGLYPRPPIR